MKRTTTKKVTITGKVKLNPSENSLHLVPYDAQITLYETLDKLLGKSVKITIEEVK